MAYHPWTGRRQTLAVLELVDSPTSKLLFATAPAAAAVVAEAVNSCSVLYTALSSSYRAHSLVRSFVVVVVVVTDVVSTTLCLSFRRGSSCCCCCCCCNRLRHTLNWLARECQETRQRTTVMMAAPAATVRETILSVHSSASLTGRHVADMATRRDVRMKRRCANDLSCFFPAWQTSPHARIINITRAVFASDILLLLEPDSGRARYADTRPPPSPSPPEIIGS